MAFQPGQSGNPTGRRKGGIELKAMLEKVLAEIPDPKEARTRAENVVRRVVEAAELGEEWAIAQVWDRAEGKPRQGIDLEARATILVQNLLK